MIVAGEKLKPRTALEDLSLLGGGLGHTHGAEGQE